MTMKIFEQPAAYMVHDIGPCRFYRSPACMTNWGRSSRGKALLAIMAPFGLDRRDAYLGHAEGKTRISTDLGSIQFRDEEFALQRVHLEATFAGIAAGIAQERMLRLSGWRPGDDMPHWSVTASSVLVQLARCEGKSLTEAWDVEGYVGTDTYISFYGTGMHLSWYDDDLSYCERTEGATLTLPTALLGADPTSLGGRMLAEVCTASGPLASALGRYKIVETTPIEPDPRACTPEPHHTILRLAVPMRTLQPIPELALVRAGVTAAPWIERDYPLWMLTPPELLRRYRPRLG